LFSVTRAYRERKKSNLNGFAHDALFTKMLL
jgi:hypothetical protein